MRQAVRGLAIVLIPALLALSCEQQTWESAMLAGQRAMQQGRYEEAVRAFAAAARKAEPQPDRMGLALSGQAQALATHGDYVAAEPVYLQALKAFQDAHGENHADVAATLNNLGVLHRMHGQYPQAEPLLVRALAIKERIHGADHPEVALSLHHLGLLYVAQGQPNKAEPLYRRALAIRERVLGPDHADVAKSIEALAGVLRALHREAEAASLEARLAANRIPRS